MNNRLNEHFPPLSVIRTAGEWALYDAVYEAAADAAVFRTIPMSVEEFADGKNSTPAPGQTVPQSEEDRRPLGRALACEWGSSWWAALMYVQSGPGGDWMQAFEEHFMTCALCLHHVEIARLTLKLLPDEPCCTEKSHAGRSGTQTGSDVIGKEDAMDRKAPPASGSENARAGVRPLNRHCGRVTGSDLPTPYSSAAARAMVARATVATTSAALNANAGASVRNSMTSSRFLFSIFQAYESERPIVALSPRLLSSAASRALTISSMSVRAMNARRRDPIGISIRFSARATKGRRDWMCSITDGGEKPDAQAVSISSTTCARRSPTSKRQTKLLFRPRRTAKSRWLRFVAFRISTKAACRATCCALERRVNCCLQNGRSS